MNFTMTETLSQANDVLTVSLALTADAKDVWGDANTPVNLPATTTTTLAVTANPTTVVSYFVLATVGCTLTTANSTGSPDVITMVANQPLVWHNKMQLAKHFTNTNPWTSWAFNNSGTVAGTVRIMIARTGTP